MIRIDTKIPICFFSFLPLFLGIIPCNASSFLFDENTPETNGSIYSVVSDDSDVYIGGDFTSVGTDFGSGGILDATTGSLVSVIPPTYNGIHAIVSDTRGGWYVSLELDGNACAPKIVHILADGNRDPNFNVNITGCSVVNSLALSATTEDLYVGGSFDFVGGQTRHGIAKIKTIDGSIDASFNPDLNRDGSYNFNVYTLAFATSTNDIYIGGNFNRLGGITKRGIVKLSTVDGSPNAVFTTSGPQTNPGVYAIVDSGTYLYVGGAFSSPRANLIKLYSDTGASAVTSPVTFNANMVNLADYKVTSLALSGDNLYVGGSFYQIGGKTRFALGKISATNGVADLAFDPRIFADSGSSEVRSIILSGADLYIGGNFKRFDNGGIVERYAIAKLNATNGTVNASFVPSIGVEVNALALSGNSLAFVCTGAGPMQAVYRTGIAKINKATNIVDPTFNPNINAYDGYASIYSLLLSGSDLYVGGNFISADEPARENLAKLNTTDGRADMLFNPHVQASGDTASATVYSLALSDRDLYMGGYFDFVGGQTRNNIAKLSITDGTVDVRFDPDANGEVRSLLLSGTDLYTGGHFTSFGGITTRNGLAKINTIDGTIDPIFNPNISGLSYPGVQALALSGANLYVGGLFTGIGPLTRNNIAKLNVIDGTADAMFNPNANGSVYGLALSDTNLYAGGEFSNIGGSQFTAGVRLSALTGIPDIAFGSAVSGYFRSLDLSGSNLYVGGSSFDFIEGGRFFRSFFHLILDSLSPTLSLSGSALINTPSHTYTATLSDTLSPILSLEYQIDSTSGSWTSCTPDDETFDEKEENASCSLSNLTEGSHTIYFRTSDTSQNISDAFPVSLTVDLTAPSSSLKQTLFFKSKNNPITKTSLNKESKNYVQEQKPKIQGTNTSAKNGTVSFYRKDGRTKKTPLGTAPIDGKGKWNFTLPKKKEQGTIDYRLVFTDQAGNVSESSSAFQVTRDWKKPDFRSPLPDTIQRNQTVSFTATDTRSGIDFYKVSFVGKGQNKHWIKQKIDTFTVPKHLPSGTYILTVRATDKAGNTKEVQKEYRVW